MVRAFLLLGLVSLSAAAVTNPAPSPGPGNVSHTSFPNYTTPTPRPIQNFSDLRPVPISVNESFPIFGSPEPFPINRTFSVNESFPIFGSPEPFPINRTFPGRSHLGHGGIPDLHVPVRHPVLYPHHCFPSTATVELLDGSFKQMSAVQIGDRVKVADGTFSHVYMFTHKMADASNEFVIVKTKSGAELQLTSGHYMYVNGALVAAGTIRVGDFVESASGEPLTVASVGSKTMDGLYNPQTSHGDIIVNGIRASTFTTAVQPSAAQALLAPMRALYAKLGFATAVLNQGSDVFA